MSASDSDEFTPDDIFDLLSNHRRRMVLHHLRQNGTSAEVSEIAAAVAALENDTTVEELTDQQRKRVYVSLYQTHLPKMAEMNIIEYDKEGGTVELANQDAVDRYLTDGDQSTYPWTYHNAVLVGGAGLLLLLSLLDVSFFSELPTLGVLVTVFVVFAVSATIQVWHMRNRSDEIPPELRRYD